MLKNRMTRVIAACTAGTAGLGALAVLPASQAGAASAPVNITLKCSGASLVNLQLQREDTGKVSVDFGVDMARHKAAVQWKVTETNNGTTFVNKSVRTIRDGSFSISSVLAPAPSTTVVGTAVNATSGETCNVSGTV
jgi:hypothetical protein